MKNKLNPLLNNSGSYRGEDLNWWREHTREILDPSILKFGFRRSAPRASATDLIGQFREIAQTDEAERKTRTRGGGIKVGEDGVITQIANRAKYYFGPLEGVDGGDGAQVPDGATFDSIGKILDTMKNKLNPLLNNSGSYRGEDLNWARTHSWPPRPVDTDVCFQGICD